MVTKADLGVGADVNMKKSILARFEREVARDPSHVAVKTETVTHTYDGLNRAANRLAHALLLQVDQVQTDRGQHRDDVRCRGTIALLFDQGAEVITAFLGTLKAGLTVVPLDPAYPPSRTTYMLADSQASLMVTDTAHAGLARKLAQGRCPVLNLDPSRRSPRVQSQPAYPPRDLRLYLIYIRLDRYAQGRD